MKDLILEIRQKEDYIKQLQEEYENLPKNINREEFIFKIMDVVKNIEKQKLEINKYLIEVYFVLILIF
jgi:hypothetical protein